MNNDVDCEVFQDQLDALKEGRLSDEGTAQLRLHAAACAECSVLLRMHQHLAPISLEELETQVPDLHLASMWDRVQTGIAGQGSGGRSGPKLRGRRRTGWLVPTLAVASLLMLVSTSLLVSELSRSRRREAALADRLETQQRRLDRLESVAAPRVATFGGAGRRAWEHALHGRKSVTIGELQRLLGSLPAGMTLLDDASLNVFGSLGKMGWRELLSEIDAADGVQAGELERALRTLDLDPGVRIPVDRLLAIRGSDSRPGRS